MTPTPDHQDELYIDSSLLRAVIKKRWKLWTFTGLFLFVLIVFIMLLFVPQKYTSTTSLSIQSSASPMGGALSVLTGQSENKKYLGILSSRRLAERVANDVDLYQKLRFRDRADMLERLQGMVSANEDSVSGLVFISVTVKGPPYIPVLSKLNRQKIKNLAKEIANAYAKELKRYYVDNDNARDTVLLRGANQLLKMTKDNYYKNRDLVMLFIRKHLKMTYMASLGKGGSGTLDIGSSADLAMTSASGGDTLSGSSSGDSSSSSPLSSMGASTSLPGGSSGVSGLYQGLLQIQTDLKGLEAGYTEYNSQVNKQLKNIDNIPEEDPLLMQARRSVLEQKLKLEELRIQYSDTNPLVVVAKNELAVAEAQLKREIRGIKNHYTSDSVVNSVREADLEAKRLTLLQNIHRMEKGMMLQGLQEAKFDELKTDLMLSLAAFKETEVDAAKLRLETVSAQSRINVVDTAIDARTGNPRPRIMLSIALALVIAFIGALIIRDYNVESKARKKQEITPAS